MICTTKLGKTQRQMYKESYICIDNSALKDMYRFELGTKSDLPCDDFHGTGKKLQHVISPRFSIFRYQVRQQP